MIAAERRTTPRPLLSALAWFALVLSPCSLSAQADSPQIDWSRDGFDSALEQGGKAPSKGLLIYFWIEGNDACKAMFGETMADARVVKAASDYVCLGCKQQDNGGQALFDRYHVRQVPTVMIVAGDGTIIDAVAGYQSPQAFREALERIDRGEGTVAALRSAAEGKPDDLDLQLAYAGKLRAIGEHEQAAKLLGEIVDKDPKYKHEAAAHAELLRLFESCTPPERAAADVDLGPIEKFLVKAKHQRIRFLGYDRIAAVQYARGQLEEAIKTVAKAFKSCPDDEILDWGRGIGSKAFLEREKLDKRALKLALDISSKTLDAAEKARAERGDIFLADVYYLHGAMLIANSKRKQGFASMEKAIELDPKNENLKAMLDSYKSGAR